MMIRINEKSLFSLAVLMFVAILLYRTVDMHDDVALVPRIVGSLLLLLSMVQVVIDLFPAVETHLPFLSRKSSDDMLPGGEGVTQEESGAAMKAKYVFFAWLAGFVVLLYFTSIIWASVVAMFVYLKIMNQENWAISILYPVSTAVFIYLVFVVGFKLDFFLA